jgi:energy-coupling factor transporter ATP-binding protein EcfA2
MRLRYWHLEDEAPLQNITIPFGQERVLGRNCAIRFIVGINGSGKSRLLRALAQLFLTLERNPNGRPPFPVTLVYDLAWHPETKEPYQRTIFLRYDGRGSELVWRVHQPAPEPAAPCTTPAAWDSYLQTYEEIPTSAYGQQASFSLPQTLLAYSSGLSRDWEALFAPLPIDTATEQEEIPEERPAAWSVQQEIQYQLTSGTESAQRFLEAQEKLDPERYTLLENETEKGFFVSGPVLKLAMCAVALHQARQDLPATAGDQEKEAIRQRVRQAVNSQRVQSGLRGLLDEVGWLWPVTVTLTLDPTRVAKGKVQQWAELVDRCRQRATCHLTEPDPGQAETFIFDLFDPLRWEDQDGRVLAALIDLFRPTESSEPVTALAIFKQLYRWHTAGYLRELTMSLQKEGVDDLLLYDWLSDGEQLFLGRMALFHLLQDEQDALLILDEPETHFNDVWKRRIVDIIDDSLRDQHHEIVISTHSSIALTDVFHTEVALLNNGNASQPVIRTFGASPTEIMRSVFGAPDSVGQRASEFLELLLMLVARPDDVESLWKQDADEESIKDNPLFAELHKYVQAELAHAWFDLGDDEELKERVANALVNVRAYTIENMGQSPITAVDALNLLEKNLLGPGYYQFEFSRRVRGLRKREA